MPSSTTTTTTTTIVRTGADGKVTKTSSFDFKQSTAPSFLARPDSKQSRRWAQIKAAQVEDCRVKHEIQLLKDETNANALKKLGYIHLRNGVDDNDALQFGAMLLTRVMKDPQVKSDGRYWSYLGKSHLKIYQKSARLHREKFHLIIAFQAYSKALCFIENITNPAIWAESAQVHELLGSFQGAEQTLARLMKEFPKYPDLAEIVFRAGYVLKQLGKFDQAIGYFKHVAHVVRPPFTQSDAYFFIARIYRQKGDPASLNEANTFYKMAFDAAKPSGLNNTHVHQSVTSWVQDAVTFRQIGHKCMRQAKPGLAADLFAQALQLMQTDQTAEAWLDLAQAYWDCTVAKSAMQAVKSALVINPLHKAAQWQLKIWEEPPTSFERSVQAALAPMLSVTMSDEINGATKIQSVIRGRSGRIEVAHKQEAAVKMQTVARGRQGRKAAAVKAEARRQSTDAGEPEVKAGAGAGASAGAEAAAEEMEKPRELSEAEKIAAELRAERKREEEELARKKREAKEAQQAKKQALADERKRKRDAAAEARRKRQEEEQARKRKKAAEDKKRREAEEQERLEKEAAALKLQSMGRGKLGRKKAFLQKQKIEMENQKFEYSLTAEEEAKVPKIQAAVRGGSDRKRVKNLRRREEEVKAERERAAKQFAENQRRAEAEAAQAKIDEEAKTAVALKLQKVQRGNHDRLKVKKKKGRMQKAEENKKRAAEKAAKKEEEAKKELAQAVSMGSFMPHNARIYSFLDPKTSAGGSGGGGGGSSGSGGGSGGGGGGGRTRKPRAPDSFLDPAKSRLDTRCRESLKLFKRCGYSNGSSAYVEHWQRLLEFSFCFFKDKMERRRCVAQVKMFHPTISNAMAFCALAHCNGSVGEACGKLTDQAFQRDISSICAVVDVEAFAQLEVQEKQTVVQEKAARAMLQPWRTETMKTGPPLEKPKVGASLAYMKGRKPSKRLEQDSEYRRSSAAKMALMAGDENAPARSPMRSMAYMRAKAKEQQAAMARLAQRKVHEDEEQRHAIDAMIEQVLEAERAMLRDQPALGKLHVIHKDEWGISEAAADKTPLSRKGGLYTPLQLEKSDWELVAGSPGVGSGVGLASGQWS